MAVLTGVRAFSQVATITVLGPAHIYVQPQSKGIAPGPWTLSVDALGPNPQTYQWYAGASGDTSSPIGGATASSYTTPGSSSPANYWVRVSNPYGSTDSDTASLTIGPGPAITMQPQSHTIPSGSEATLSVAATGTGPLTYQWYAFVPYFGPIDGATESSYATGLLTAGEMFLVRVSDTLGTVESALATITIGGVGVAPGIATQPQNQTIMSGSTATLSVAATGNGPLTYQWYTFDPMFRPIGGATSSSYTTVPLVADETFLVRVTNPFGTTESATATVTIGVAPHIATQPPSMAICPGGAGTMGLSLTGTAPFTYQWYAGNTGDTSTPVGSGGTVHHAAVGHHVDVLGARVEPVWHCGFEHRHLHDPPVVGDAGIRDVRTGWWQRQRGRHDRCRVQLERLDARDVDLVRQPQRAGRRHHRVLGRPEHYRRLAVGVDHDQER